jgi:hypothetical protein
MKRWGIMAAAVILALTGLIWSASRQLPPNPVYNGKRLSVWLEAFGPKEHQNTTKWDEASDALRQIGTNSVPLLLQLLRARDSKLKLKVVELAQKQELFKIDFIPASDRRMGACKAFAALRNLGQDAVPELIKIYGEENSSEFRSSIEYVFSCIGPDARSAIPLLLRAATNSDFQIRVSALWALGSIHAEPQSCVPVLIQALHETNDFATMSAAHALGMFGTNAQAAIPLLRAQADSDLGQNLARGFAAIRVDSQNEARDALVKINPSMFVYKKEKLPPD